MKRILYKFISIFALFIFTFWDLSFAQEIIVSFTGWCLTWVWNECFVINPEDDRDLMSIAQDIILAGTYAVWTVLTLVIIYCWLWYIFASRDGKDVSKYKKWLIYACIWALFVRWAYAIVRLIQYIAQW